jgi:hypothetical protein
MYCVCRRSKSAPISFRGHRSFRYEVIWNPAERWYSELTFADLSIHNGYGRATSI